MPSPTGTHWRTLKHNGVAFPEPYKPRGLSILINRRRVRLSPLAEEMAYAWAKRMDTDYVKDPVFQANFLKDFLSQLPEEFHSVSSFGQIDFRDMYRLVREEKRLKELMSKEERKRLAAERKRRRQELKEKYGWTEVDGHRVEVQSWMVEPPGLFMGRGQHPLRGRWKPRVRPEDVTINIGMGVAYPPGRWKAVAHRQDCMWLASWLDELTGKEKYVWLHETTGLRQQRDKMKYDLATQLEMRVDRVRLGLSRAMRAKNADLRKTASVCYLVDKLCMRVGDEKDPDEADTMGATTLRVEHVRIDENNIQFDFLGKDSVHWHKTIPLSECDRAFLRNLRDFLKDKRPSENIFDGITSSKVNRFLSRLMPGLTAKVFRTYHATRIVREYLGRLSYRQIGEVVWEKLYHAKMANIQAAVACNHKRTPPKNWEESLRKKEETLSGLLKRSPRTPRQGAKRLESITILKLRIKLARLGREYNLATSLKNYIDPRVYVSWSRYVGLDWRLVYTKSLQRKFSWAVRSRLRWMARETPRLPAMIRAPR